MFNLRKTIISSFIPFYLGIASPHATTAITSMYGNTADEITNTEESVRFTCLKDELANLSLLSDQNKAKRGRELASIVLGDLWKADKSAQPSAVREKHLGKIQSILFSKKDNLHKIVLVLDYLNHTKLIKLKNYQSVLLLNSKKFLQAITENPLFIAHQRIPLGTLKEVYKNIPQSALNTEIHRDTLIGSIFGNSSKRLDLRSGLSSLRLGEANLVLVEWLANVLEWEDMRNITIHLYISGRHGFSKNPAKIEQYAQQNWHSAQRRLVKDAADNIAKLREYSEKNYRSARMTLIDKLLSTNKPENYNEVLDYAEKGCLEAQRALSYHAQNDKERLVLFAKKNWKAAQSILIDDAIDLMKTKPYTGANLLLDYAFLGWKGADKIIVKLITTNQFNPFYVKGISQPKDVFDVLYRLAKSGSIIAAQTLVDAFKGPKPKFGELGEDPVRAARLSEIGEIVLTASVTPPKVGINVEELYSDDQEKGAQNGDIIDQSDILFSHREDKLFHDFLDVYFDFINAKIKGNKQEKRKASMDAEKRAAIDQAYASKSEHKKAL